MTIFGTTKTESLVKVAKHMKVKKEVLIAAILGLIIGIPQGMRDLPNMPSNLSNPEGLLPAIGFGGISGLLLGMHLLSRANPNLAKTATFTFFSVGPLSIGLTTIARHYDGNLIGSINLVAAFFTSIGFSMFIAGAVSFVFSRSSGKDKD